MTGNHSTEDGRVTRRYFFFPAYVALVFLLAVLMVLPTIFYGGPISYWKNLVLI